MQQRVILAVINDLSQDQRLHKICTSLLAKGYSPLLVGTLRKNSRPLTPREYHTKRLTVFIQKGPLSYLEFNLRLFWYLLFQPCDIITSNDLDTLLPCFWISRLRGKRLIYDTHEYFTEQPELAHRPRVQRLWERLERYLFPKLDKIMTVNQSLAHIYAEKYGKDIQIVRNFPKHVPYVGHPQGPAGAAPKIVIYQGNVNLSRGIDIMLQALQHLENVEFWCVGPGDLLEEMKQLASQLKVQDKVRFWGLIPFEQLRDITLQASIGISIEQPIGKNSLLCLPNKLLDYIQCRIPVIVSDLPEMRALVQQYQVGKVLTETTPQNLAMAIKDLLGNEQQYASFRENCELASSHLCWEQEENTLLGIYNV